MDLKEFKNSIPSLVEQAIDTAHNITEGKNTLTSDISDIDKMDEIVRYIHNLRKKNLIDDDVSWNISVSFGTLLGEMIINEHKFHWALNDDEIPVVETDDHDRLSPITKLYKIITDEEDCEGSPSGFYKGFLAIKQYNAMNDEDKKK